MKNSMGAGKVKFVHGDECQFGTGTRRGESKGTAGHEAFRLLGQLD